MPDGYRTERVGSAGRALIALCLAVAIAIVGISAYVWATQAVTPERGSAGAVSANSPSPVRARPQE